MGGHTNDRRARRFVDCNRQYGSVASFWYEVIKFDMPNKWQNGHALFGARSRFDIVGISASDGTRDLVLGSK